MDKIRIVHIIANLQSGGAEMMLLKLVSSIDRKKYQPFVISLMNLGEIGPIIKAQSIPVFSIGAQRGLFSLSNFFYLIRLLRDLRPDIVHTWMYHADLLGGLAAKISGCRRIIWGIRHSNLSFKHNKLSTILVAKICSILSHWVPNLIITCSVTAKTVHELFGYAKNKIVVIPNGFSVDRFCPSVEHYASVREELCLPPQSILVGLVARYDPLKNHLGFIEAAAIISSILPSVHFVLVGSGVSCNNTHLLQVIRFANLESRFHLLGYRSDIPRLMSSFDILASPSIGEGFSNSIGEAMASGVVCVVTNVGDSGYLVGETGFVVHDSDMARFAEAMISALQLEPHVRSIMSAKARDRVLELFDLPKVVALFENAYDSLID